MVFCSALMSSSISYQTHIVIMVVALLLAIGGFITTFEHARNGGLPKFLSDVSVCSTIHLDESLHDA